MNKRHLLAIVLVVTIAALLVPFSFLGLLVTALLAVAAAAALSFYLFVSRREQHDPDDDRAKRGPERGAEREPVRVRRLGRARSRVRPLSKEARRRYEEEWERVERDFVDRPAAALDDADRVVSDVLAERNLLTNDHRGADDAAKSATIRPDVATNLREARRACKRSVYSRDGDAEEMRRRAIQNYRSVYAHLTEE